MPQTVSSYAHVNVAVNMYNAYSASQVWIGIGNPSSGSWSSPASDTSPPTPTSTSTLDNPIGYKKVDTWSLVYPSSSGTITYSGQQWAIATPSTAYTNNANSLYIAASINYSELPTNVYYREIAIFVGLQPIAGATGNALLPNQVQSVGNIIMMDYAQPTLRNANEQELIRYMISF